mmetsp:Transcript_27181/g.90343  ORF Transcript_27181/g.90343 Transcript_27181/m.90343 type:complete len:108 (+) Transcript_27181:476-799(+)
MRCSWRVEPSDRVAGCIPTALGRLLAGDDPVLPTPPFPSLPPLAVLVEHRASWPPATATMALSPSFCGAEVLRTAGEPCSLPQRASSAAKSRPWREGSQCRWPGGDP